MQRALFSTAMLGCGIALFRSHTVSELRAERARLTTHSQLLTSDARRLSANIEEAERSREATAGQKKVRLAAINKAIHLLSQQSPPPEIPRIPAPPTGPRGNRIFAELMHDPEYAKLCAVVFRQEVDVAHGALLARFRAEPEKLEALTQLLIERRFVDLESEDTAIRQGLSSIEQPKARYGASDRLEDEIRALAGDALHKQLK